MKIKDLVTKLSQFDPEKQVVIQTQKVPQLKEDLDINFDDVGTAVLYEVSPDDTENDRMNAKQMVERLQEGDPEKEAVIETDEDKDYTADFEVKYINGIIFLCEMANSKAW